MLEITVQNDQVVSSMFGDAGSMGVVGIYLGVVFVVGSGLRKVFDKFSE